MTLSEHESFDGKLPGAENRPETEEIFAPFVPDEDHYIFVSYSHADRERVFPIITRLYEKGWHVWYDQGLELGENYYVELARHIQNCDAFLLFITENAVKSEFVSNNEVLYACNRSKVIIQCRLDKDACFPEETNEALELATASKKHPKTDEAWLEVALLSIKGLPRFSPRIAEGYQVRARKVDIPIATENDEYEFIMCPGGIKLGKYLGKAKSVTVPLVYKGHPVVEMNLTFSDNETVQTLYIPEGVRCRNGLSLNCKYLKDLYIPASYLDCITILWSAFNDEFRLVSVHRSITIHCPKGSIATSSKVYKFVVDHGGRMIDDYNDMPNRSSFYQYRWHYAVCSYASSEASVVEEIVQRLRECSCEIIDIHDLPKNEILLRFRKADVFVAFISKSYLESQNCDLLYIAHSMGKPCFLWALEDCKYPAELSLIQENCQQIRNENGTKEGHIAKLSLILKNLGCQRTNSTEMPDYSYTTKADGILLTDYRGQDADVMTPSSFSGIPIVGVMKCAYSRRCEGIKTITIPNSISLIEYGAFKSTSFDMAATTSRTHSSIEAIHILAGNKSYQSDSEGCLLSADGKEFLFHPPQTRFSRTEYIVSEGITTIGSYAFEGNSNLTSVLLPKSLAVIGDHSFQASGLRNITIPNSVKSIGCFAFYGCEFLQSICLPGELSQISDQLFAFCTSLRRITLPNGIKHIGDRAFSFCVKLDRLLLPDGLISIGEQAFIGIEDRVTIFVPDSVREIGVQAFDEYVTVCCSRNSYTWKYCEREGISHRASDGGFANGVLSNDTRDDTEDILRIFK